MTAVNIPGKIVRFLGNRLRAYRLYRGVVSGTRAFTVPYRFSICPTYRCNLRCLACWCYSPLVGDKGLAPDQRRLDIPYEPLARTVTYLLDRGTRYVSISGGGDPLLYGRITDLLKCIRNYPEVHCDLNTNLTAVDENMIAVLLSGVVDTLIVSVWAGTAAGYAAVHDNCPGTVFPKLVADLTRLNDLRRQLECRLDVVLNHVVFSANYHEFEQMVELAYRTGATQLRFTHMDVVPGKTERLCLTAEARQELLEQAELIDALMQRFERQYGHHVSLVEFADFKRRLSRKDQAGTGCYDQELMKCFHCYAGWSFFQVFPDGNFNSCCRIVEPRGNISDARFADVWNGAAQREFRLLTRDLDTGKIARQGLPCSGLCDNLHDSQYVAGQVSHLTRFEKAAIRLLAGRTEELQ